MVQSEQSAVTQRLAGRRGDRPDTAPNPSKLRTTNNTQAAPRELTGKPAPVAGSYYYIAKVRFRPEPGSRRRTATKPAQDEPIWEGSKLFKTLYNCFTIENDTAMPRFGRGVYALW